MLNESYTFLLLKTFIIVSFFQGTLFLIGIPGSVYKATISYFCLFLVFEILFAVRIKKSISSGIFISLIIIYTLCVIVSGIYNSDPFSEIFSYYLYTLPGFLVYLIVSNKNFNDNQILQFNKLFIALFFLQIAAAVLKFIFKGTSESLIGTIHFSNGSLNTILPLIAISMIIGFYFFYKNDKNYFLLSAFFMFIAFAGEKRGVYFYLVALLFLSYIFFLRVTNQISLRKISFFILVFIPSLFVIIYIGVRIAPTLNPEDVYGGSFDLSYLINYVVSYIYQFDDSGLAGGRLSGLINIFKSIYFNPDLSSFLIGDGPGTLLGIQDVRFNDIAARYMVSTLGLGVNGWSAALISLGFIGAITVTSIYFYILTVSYKQTKIEITPYWKAISFGTFLISTIFFMDFFTYSRSFYHTIPLNIILFYLIGIIERRRHNH